MYRRLQHPIDNERGERLLAVHEGEAGIQDVSVSIVLARHAEGMVLVRNSQRSIWELPGGYVDAGEQPSDCALRELYEESGLQGSEIEMLGILEIERHAQRGDLLRCALYQCHAEGIPSISGAETSAVAFWQPAAKIAPISAIDEALLRRGLRGCA
jgi:ADP-ribose pyrophosphatase YjhB (NUDIX family)